MNSLINQPGQLDVLADLQHSESLVKALMQSKHYAKMGSEGIYAVVQKAKAMGINPLEALNGGAYYVQGKVELSSQMMNRLIRSKGHSIQKDPKSDKTCCILHGKRADNGDKWTVSFSLDDAKKAGLYKPGGTWEKYTEVMCFNRALSMLARQLFPDVIVDCYVQGEISDALALDAPVVEYITDKDCELLTDLVSEDEKPVELHNLIVNRLSVSEYREIPVSKFDSIVGFVKTRLEKQKQAITMETSEEKDGE